jgi:hypothetical protein
LLEVGEKCGELGLERVLLVADSQFVADGFLGFDVVEVVFDAGRADASVDAAVERVGGVDFVVGANAGGEEVFVRAGVL